MKGETKKIDKCYKAEEGMLIQGATRTGDDFRPERLRPISNGRAAFEVGKPGTLLVESSKQ